MSDKGDSCEVSLLPLFAEQLRFLKLIEARKYCKPKVFELESGADFTLDWARENGLRFPVRIKRRSGLGMVLPGPDFGVRDVARVVGPTTPIVSFVRAPGSSTSQPVLQDCIDVAAQEEIAGFTLGKWARYYCSKSHSKILNVISLEFSKTPLRHLVRSPTVVRELDWIDSIWPSNRRAVGQYPAVQYYCLMSVAGCYTDFHIDFGGTSVWYHVFKGEKRFLFIPPSKKNIQKYAEWTTSPKQSSTFFADWTPGQCFEVTLKEGHTMIIPTGWIHAVYTPKDSLVFGGNFLHGLGMAKQLEIYEMEIATRVPRKFCFPFYEHINWYAAAYYTQLARRPGFQALLKSISEFSAAKLRFEKLKAGAADASETDSKLVASGPCSDDSQSALQAAAAHASQLKAEVQTALRSEQVAMAEARELPSLAALLAKVREQQLLRAAKSDTAESSAPAATPGAGRVKGQRGAFATELQASAAAADAARLVGAADPESLLLELTRLAVPSPGDAAASGEGEPGQGAAAGSADSASQAQPQVYRCAPGFGWSLSVAQVPGSEGVPLTSSAAAGAAAVAGSEAAASGCADWYATEFRSAVGTKEALQSQTAEAARQAELVTQTIPQAMRCFDVHGAFLCKGSVPFEDDLQSATKQIALGN